MDIDFTAHAITVVGAAVLGIIGGMISTFFWMRNKLIQLQKDQNMVNNNQADSDFNRLKSLTEWQNQQYQQRSEYVDKQLSIVQADLLKLNTKYVELHTEHLKCEKERILQGAQLDILKADVKRFTNIDDLSKKLASELVTTADKAADRIVVVADKAADRLLVTADKVTQRIEENK